MSLLRGCCCVGLRKGWFPLVSDCGIELNRLARNIAVIPKSNNQARLAENLDVLGFDLTTEDIESITALDRGLRFNDPGFYLPNYPLRIFA